MTALDDLFGAAAEARAQGAASNGQSEARNLAARPSQRRADEGPRALPVVGCRAAIKLERTAEFTEDGDGEAQVTGLHFDGFASVYNRAYEMWDMFGPYSENVASGAGAVSLAKADLDVPFVIAHDTTRRIARTTNGTLTLAEETGTLGDEEVEGLHVLAELDPADVDVSYITPKLESGLIDEMSFRFSIKAGEWSPDYMAYTIKEYDINRGDVAIVGYGANPFTAGSGLRAPNLADLSERQLKRLVDDLHAEHVRRGLAPLLVRSAAVPGGNSLGISRASLLLDD